MNEGPLVSKFLLCLVTPLKTPHFLASLLPLIVFVVFLVKNQTESIPVQKGLIVEIIRLILGVAVVGIGSENRIHTQSEHILHHPWQQSLQDSRTQFQARVCIDFNEKGPEVTVHYEVQAKQLKTTFLSVQIDPTVSCPNCLSSHLLHFLMQNSHLPILPHKPRIKISLKLWITQFVAFLVFPIVVPFLLNRIISQMNKLVSQIG